MPVNAEKLPSTSSSSDCCCSTKSPIKTPPCPDISRPRRSSVRQSDSNGLLLLKYQKMKSFDGSTIEYKAKKTKAYIIGICGGSASGKTYLSEQIKHTLNMHSLTIVKQDSFYKVFDEKERELIQQNEYNFDHPDSVDFKLLISTLQKLSDGEQVEVPIYNYILHSREQKRYTLHASTVIILEGLLAFWHPAVLNMLDFKIFLDTDADLRLVRRLKRDIAYRGRNLEDILKQYTKTVHPSFNAYVAPFIVQADIIVSGERENNVMLEFIKQKVYGCLTTKGLKLEEILVDFYPTEDNMTNSLINYKYTSSDDFFINSKKLISLIIDYSTQMINFISKNMESPKGLMYKNIIFISMLTSLIWIMIKVKRILTEMREQQSDIKTCC